MKQTTDLKRLLALWIAPATLLTTMLAPAPAQAQLDWIGARVDAERFGRQLRSNQKRAKSKARQKSSTRQRTAQKAPSVERYPNVSVNLTPLKSAVPAVEIKGRTYVPLRDIFEAMETTVNYQPERGVILLARGDTRRELSLPGNGRSSRPDGDKPFVRNGTTMVPLRMVAELMGDQVQYSPHPQTPQISIISRAAS